MRFGKPVPASVLKAIGDALFPRRCPACGSFFHTPIPSGPVRSESPVNGSVFNRLFAPFVCRDCLRHFEPLTPPICTICGRPFAAAADTEHACGKCLKSPRPFLAARSCGVYSKTLMAVIHAYKYNGRIRFAQPLAALLFQFFIGYDGFHEIDTVIPVPLHRDRLRERGFNQAYKMVMLWPKLNKNEIVKIGFSIDGRTLVRSRKTVSQTGLGRAERIKNIKGAFCVKRPEAITGKNILVVDDVYTTGSTVSECASTLMKAGAAEVSVLTLARAV